MIVAIIKTVEIPPLLGILTQEIFIFFSSSVGWLMPCFVWTIPVYHMIVRKKATSPKRPATLKTSQSVMEIDKPDTSGRISPQPLKQSIP